MSTHKEYALIAILAIAAVVGVSPAFGYCPPTCAPKADYTAAMMAGNSSNIMNIAPSSGNLYPITVVTDNSMYDHNSVVMVSGHVLNPYPGQDVAIKVLSPSGNIVFATQVSLDNNGDYSTKINTASQLMAENGQYTIYVQQGDEQSRTNQVQFQIAGQVSPTTAIPEFGPIAALVLAIAIVSIIAVSAKTGLRFMPKY